MRERRQSADKSGKSQSGSGDSGAFRKVKEKAEKLGARLVLSSSYKNVLENKNYV